MESPGQIVNLVSSRPKVSKLEFFVALALLALAQSGKGVLFIHLVMGYIGLQVVSRRY